MARLPTYFVSHGGGPWPWMREQYGPAYDQLAASLAAMRVEAGETVRAVLVVTAHWETPQFMVSSGTAPGMIYDTVASRRILTRSVIRRRASRRWQGAWPSC